MGRSFLPDGTYDVSRVNLSWRDRLDLYHFFLSMSWWQLVGFFTVLFLVVNSVFALLYLAQPGSILHATPGSFRDAFHFSVQTISTVGFGNLLPATDFAHFLVTLESLVGLLGFATVAGVVFAKFSLPVARVVFSEQAVVTLQHQKPALVFRIANVRSNHIIDATVRVSLVRTETTVDGYEMRRFHKLRLRRHQQPLLSLYWMLVHPLDEASPLQGMTREELDESDSVLVVTVTGLDGTTSQTIHATHMYQVDDLVWGGEFVECLDEEGGRKQLDYALLGEIKSLPLPVAPAGGSAAGEVSPAKISVRLPWRFNAAFADHLTALEGGHFEAEGLQVSVHEGSLEEAPTLRVAAGRETFGLVGADQFLLARARGLPLVAFGVCMQSCQVVFMSRREMPLESPRDLIGRRVGIKFGSAVETTYRVLLKNAGIERREIEEVRAGVSLEPFCCGELDVFTGFETNEPLALEARGIDLNLLRPADHGVSLYGMVYFAREDVVAEHRDVVVRYLRAVLAAWKAAVASKEEAARFVTRYNPDLTQAHQVKMLERVEPVLGERPGAMTAEGWEGTQQVLLDSGMLREPLDLAKVHDLSILEELDAAGQ